MTALTDSFRSQWEASQGNDFASRMARRSLKASAAINPDLRDFLLDLEKPQQESLDLRLDGAGVKGHSTDASSLGQFMMQISEAVKQLAKSISGRNKWSHELLAFAPAPGSVQLHFELPPMKEEQATIDGTEISSFDGQAMRTLANIVKQAEEQSDALLASTSRLTPKARLAVRRMAETVLSSQWELDGQLLARGKPTVPLRLSAGGAQRLFNAADARETEGTVSDLHGTVDGWTWSSGTLRFMPSRGRPFTASVPAALQGEVAKLGGTPNKELMMTFYITKVIPAGGTGTIHTSYALRAIPRVEP